MPIEIEPGKGIPIVVPAPQPSLDGELTSTENLLTADEVPQAQPLAVPWQEQEHENWCWAACTQMVLQFHEKPVKQCDVARKKFTDQNTCNVENAILNCDEGCTETEVAHIYSKFKITPTPKPSFVEFEVLENEINTHKRPVEVGLQWPGNGRHLVIVFAAFKNAQGDTLLGVNDPWLGRSPAVHYESLKTAYTDERGTWIRTWLDLKKPTEG